MKKLMIAVLGAAGLMLASTGSAFAEVNWSVSVGGPMYGAPVYPAPQVVYPAPQVVYQPAPQVIYPSAPRMIYGAPVMVPPQPYGGYGYGGYARPAPTMIYYGGNGWGHHHHHHDWDDRGWEGRRGW